MRRKQVWAKRVRKERGKKRYLSKQQAVRKLQVDSMTFRRLCILKGIYPRALGRSKQKASGDAKQYYLTKEIKWLVHDAVPQSIFAYRAWEKKMARATAMKAKEEQRDLRSRYKPKYSLSATIKERYPYFNDAIRDVDDAMTNIALYAFLAPEVNANSTIEFHHALTSGLHEKAKSVLAQWMKFVSTSHTLTKGFISIKGYYYEALVRGQRIVWLMPHEYASKFPSGIQQYVLITFLEFHVELMRFVLFKLQHDLEKELAEKAMVEDEGVDPNAENFVSNDTNDMMDGKRKTAVTVALAAEELAVIAKLFDSLVFYVSRECPAKHCRFVIEACGGRVVDDFSNAVTHFVVDRPALPAPHVKLTQVEYVQPQYLYDCLNARAVLPPNGYRMGEELPPHVSPFTVSISNTRVDIAAVEEAKKKHPKIVGYVPKRVHEIRKFLDPTYVSANPKGEVNVQELDSDEEVVLEPVNDIADDVSLDGSDIAEARKRPEWVDEQVTELPQRSKLSALQVARQRQHALLNRPTSEDVAARRAIRIKSLEKAKKTQPMESRIRQKVKETRKEAAATRKMQLQVARKKAARYYKMVSGVVDGAQRREAALEGKAAAIAKGRSKPSSDGTALEPVRSVTGKAKPGAKASSPRKARGAYDKLPKWVR